VTGFIFIANLDSYVSNRLAEPVGAEAHYTEQLVCLNRFPMYLSKPARAPERRREDFGLPVDRRVYLCPQSLFKLHPDFDGLVEGILRQDRNGVVVLFDGKHPRWRQLLLQRMALRMPDLVGRILFLPRVAEDAFPSVLRLADAVIDPPHFTGCLQLTSPPFRPSRSESRGCLTVALGVTGGRGVEECPHLSLSRI